MFAIIESGGRQIRVEPGAVVQVDRLTGENGTEVTFNRVLVVEKDGGEFFAGSPYVADARVVGVVEGEDRGPKIRVFKKRRRKRYRNTKGHRSTLTRVKVREILV